MSEQNPFTPPAARVADVPPSSQESIETLNRIASGQRQVMFALLAQISAAILTRPLPQFGLVLAFAAFVFAVVALVRLTSALGFSAASRVLLSIGLLIPLVSLIILAVVSSRASKRLRANGFHVGFLGAKPREG